MNYTIFLQTSQPLYVSCEIEPMVKQYDILFRTEN